MSIAAVAVGLFITACIGLGVYLIITSRRSAGEGPRCGYCRYNLTGSAANRCPECGKPFIEAGVMVGSRTWRPRLWIGIAILVVLVPLVCSGIVTSVFYARARAEQSRALAAEARARAITQFLQQALDDVQRDVKAPATTTAPVTVPVVDPP